MSIVANNLINPSIAINNGKKIVSDSNGILYCCFYATINSYTQIFVYKSEDDANTWTNMNFPQIDDYNQLRPSIAVDCNNKIHIVWEGLDSNTIYAQIKYSNNISGSWSNWTNIQSLNGYNQEAPSIAIDFNNKVHVVWHGRDSGNISYYQIKYSNNISGTWSNFINIQTITGYHQLTPSIVIDSNNKLHVTWHGLDSNNPSYYQIKYSNNVTGTWSTWTNIQSLNRYDQQISDIAIDSNNKLHIVWCGYDSNNTTYNQIKYSNNIDGSWSNWINIQTITGYSQLTPSIVIDGNNKCHVTWYGRDSNNPSYYQIKYSNNISGTWSTWTNKTNSNIYNNENVSCIYKNNNLYCIYNGDTTVEILEISTIISVTEIILNKTTDTIIKGNTDTLIATILPSNANNKNITWSSSDTNIATVDNNGLVTTISTGSCIITCTTQDGEFKATCNITVTIPVTGIMLSKATLNINIGNTNQLLATILPSNASNKNITWSSSNTNIATIDSNGLVTAISQGICTITVSTVDGNFKNICTINVISSGDDLLITNTLKYLTAFNNNGKKIIADSNNILYCCFYDQINTKYQIFVFKSDDNGISWMDTNFPQISGYDQECPSIAIDSNNNLHVVWFGVDSNNIYHQIKYSNNISGNWSNWINIQSSLSGYTQTYPSIAIDSNNKCHVIWQGNDSSAGGAGIKYSNNVDGSWSNYIIIENSSVSSQWFASIAIDSNNKCHATWYGPGGVSLAYGEIKYSNNISGTWSTSIITSNLEYNQLNPNIAIDNNNKCHIVWRGYDFSNANKYQIKYSNNISGSWRSWTNIQVITGYDQYNPDIVIDNNNKCYVTWSGYDSSNTTKRQIKYSNNVSGTWKTWTNKTNNNTSSENPSYIYRNKLYCIYNMNTNIKLFTEQNTTYVTGITLNKTTDTIIKGNTDTLIAAVIPSNASNKNVMWNSSDTNIATVDSSGLVTAINGGTCTITATTQDGNYKATCNINVIVPVIGITLNKTSNTIIVGQTDTLVSTILPNDTSNKNVTWNSSNTNIATVDSSGVVTAINAGNCIITCTTQDGNYIATCNITTIVLVSGITLDKITDTIVVGNKDQLTATVVPNTATSKNITWTSSNTSIATVDNNGLVTAISNGNCIITATTNDGNYSATCNVTSIILTNGVTLNKTTNTIIKGNTDTLIATIYPLTATNKNVIWSSSDTSIAAVDNNGLVTAIDGGTCIITVKTQDGNYSATCNINVIIPVTGVTLNKTSDTIIKDNTDTLIPTISPSNASNKNITWSSSDTNIATVDNNGKITAINGGSCIITCTTVESNYTATCNITVTVPVTGITLNKTTDTINIEDLDQLIPTIVPSNATNKNIIWNSSDINIATVNNGLVTSISPGTCIITCTTIDGNYKATCNITVASSITDLTLNKTIENLIINTTEQLNVTILPSDAIYKDITWTSSNPTMVTVNNNGLVTGIGYGKTLITVSIISFSGKVLKSATCNITVINKTIYPTKVKIDKFADDIYMNTTVNLKAIIYPTYATNKNVTWSSSDTNIATVDNNGLVTGISPGISIITASLESYDKYIRDAVCYIIVRKNIYATSITLDKTIDTIYEGETHQLIATITPNNTTSKDIIWSSSDTNIAIVNSSGLVTAISEGTCTIYAVIDNVYTSCNITVPDSNTLVTDITLDKTEVTINIGGHERLIPTVYPNNAENKEIIWSGSDTNGILVNSCGTIFAKRAGTYTITATTKDNNKTATCKVTVTTPVKNIILNKQEIALSRNMKKKLIATIIPKDATNKEINWTSSDINIATVDNNGIVTGILKGQCIIAATTVDGNITTKCNVTII